MAFWLSLPGQREVVVDVRAGAARPTASTTKTTSQTASTTQRRRTQSASEAVEQAGHLTPLSNTTATPSAFTETLTARPYTFA